MQILSPFREITKIGKSFLTRIVGVQENHKIIEYKESIDFHRCNENCPILKLMIDNPTEDNMNNTYCHTQCEAVKVKTSIIRYINENNKYRLYSPVQVPDTRKQRLSKSQIKQILYYHFLMVDNQGIIKNINLNNVSKALNCSTKTIINNNKRFKALGLIGCTYIDNNLFNIVLVEYPKYHLSKNQGGTGYIQITQELLFELLKMDDVNALRFELRKLLRFDSDNIQASQEQSKYSYYSYNEVKYCLPSQISYTGIIEKTVDKHTEAFNTKKQDNKVLFILNNNFNAKLVKQQRETEYTNIFSELCYEKSFSIFEKDIDDLCQMSFEYGFSNIVTVLNFVIDNEESYDIELGNIGSIIRTHFKMQNQYSLQVVA